MVTLRSENLFYPHPVGGYCEWKLTTDAIKAVAGGKIYQCFDDFRQDLYLDCTDNPHGFGIFKFTPDENTPDEIYYQVSVTIKCLIWFFVSFHMTDS